MRKVRIFLDMDGVLANFTKAACEHFAIKYPVERKRLYPKWLNDECGIPKHVVDDLMFNYDYWYNIELYSYTKDLINLCHALADEVYILSKPMHHENCYVAKLDWCIDKLNLDRKQLIITEAPKHLLASDYSDILIDDKVEMIEKWYAAGGEGFWWQEIVENKHTHEFAKYRFQKIIEIVDKVRKFQKQEKEKSKNNN